MRIFAIIPLIYLLFISVPVNAQNIYSNHPPKLKWQRLETKHLEIVFPKGLDSVAQRTANMMEHVYEPVTKSLETDPRKISFFLFNQSSISNGYVTPVLPMMAWYTTPMQDVRRLGADDWFQTLAVHEYRHVTQFEKMNQGATHTAGVLFGKYGSSIIALMSHPLWFAEGDAVLTETVLSNGGRGRVPSFSAPMRAIVLEGQKHSYDRTYMGSYKYYYPNHYTLGYYLATYGRRSYGTYFWSDVLDRTSRFSFWPYQFSMSLRHEAGLSARKFYKSAFVELEGIWRDMEIGRIYTYSEPVKVETKRVYTNYENPLMLDDGSLFAIKKGFDHSAQFIIIKNGIEEKLLNRAPDGDVTTNGSLLVWSESIYDKRFAERSYSDIFTFDYPARKVNQLTKNQKYFAPAISPDGKTIVAVEYTDMLVCSLVFLSAETGSVIKSKQVEHGEFLRTPSWSSDGKTVVCTVTLNEENSIVTFDFDNLNRSIFYGPTYAAIGKPQFVGKYLVYNSPETGVDAVAAIDLTTGVHYLALQTRFGAYSPCISADRTQLIYEDYNSMGMSLVSSEFDSRAWQLFGDAKKQAEDYFLPVVEQEQGGSVFETEFPDSTYAVQKYRKVKNLINVHSWVFVPQTEGVALSLISNNKLNTLSASASVFYNENERAFSESLGLYFMKYYPLFSILGTHGYRTDVLEYDVYNNSTDEFDKNTLVHHWQEKYLEVGMELPFNFSRNHRTTTFSVGVAGQYKYVYDSDILSQANPDWDGIESGSLERLTGNQIAFYSGKPNGTTIPILGTIDLMNIQVPAYRDIQPNWGQVLQVRTEYGLEKYSDFGTQQVSIYAKEYFPGLLPSHGITFSLGYERQSPYNLLYSAPSYLLFSRGYDYVGSDKWGHTSLSYALPLFYPDWHLGGTAHIKRFSAKFFGDYSLISESKGETYSDKLTNPLTGNNLGVTGYDYTSVGGEIKCEFNLFRWLVLPLDFGIRGSYLVRDDEFKVELMLLGAGL